MNTEKDSKSKLTDSYNALLEKERLYFKATKEFLEVRMGAVSGHRVHCLCVCVSMVLCVYVCVCGVYVYVVFVYDRFSFQECKKNELLQSKLDALTADDQAAE